MWDYMMIKMIMWHRLIDINMPIFEYNQRLKLTFCQWWQIESLELKHERIHFKVICNTVT